jgi:hypothetical protein
MYTLNNDSPSQPTVKAHEDKVEINNIEIGMQDFMFTVAYVLQNTDLSGDDDPRRALVAKVREIREVPGYNHGKLRLEMP